MTSAGREATEGVFYSTENEFVSKRNNPARNARAAGARSSSPPPYTFYRTQHQSEGNHAAQKPRRQVLGGVFSGGVGAGSPYHNRPKGGSFGPKRPKFARSPTKVSSVEQLLLMACWSGVEKKSNIYPCRPKRSLPLSLA